MILKIKSLVFVLCCVFFSVSAQLKNDVKLVEDFKDMGFGLFVHWSMDSQLGSVISHSMVGASDAYVKKYMNELPKTFNPKKFDPDEWARLFKLTGAEYVVFTVKHHNGFCMWDTKTTEFNIMNTPYGKDIAGELFKALREYNIKVGIYFSPEDFSFVYKQGHIISRKGYTNQVTNNPELLAYDKKQIDELIDMYSPDIMFFDSFKKADIVQHVHAKDPKIIVTRGEMNTPEQKIPDTALKGPWETCMTMGTQWQYKPTNEKYKSGTDLINKLIEIRAKGGNFLLNIGPKPNGEIPIEQEERLREVALWMFVNNEGIKNIRPLPNKIKDGDLWFTQNKKENAVYVFITDQKDDWFKGFRRNFLIKYLRATKETKISVLGQNDLVVEYWPENNPKSRLIQHEKALEISISRAHRLYNDKIWPNPITVKLTNVEIVE